MHITPALLISAGIAPTQARQFAEPMRAACALFDISTRLRLSGNQFRPYSLAMPHYIFPCVAT
jgi:hypothetical protein